MPLHMNPAEFLLDLVDISFSRDRVAAEKQLSLIYEAREVTGHEADHAHGRGAKAEPDVLRALTTSASKRSQLLIPLTLMHRNFIKSYRDVVAYGIRVAMYIGTSGSDASWMAELTIIQVSPL